MSMLGSGPLTYTSRVRRIASFALKDMRLFNTEIQEEVEFE